MAQFHIKKDGAWHKAKELWVNKAGTWHKARELWVKKDGAWQLLFSGGGSLTGAFMSYTAIASSGSITWQTDGGALGGGIAINPWLSPTGAGFGSAYHIRFTKAAGGATSAGGFGVWLPMSIGRSLGLNRAGAVTVSNGTYELSLDGGTTVAGSGNWTIELEA